MCVIIALVLSHLVVRPRLFYKIDENKMQKKINNDLAIVASQIPEGAVHDSRTINTSEVKRGQQFSPFSWFSLEL